MDRMILDVAVNGSADLIVAGDRDMLALGSYQGIPILTPAPCIENWLKTALGGAGGKFERSPAT
jgi:predicted nucleic acid-binding protein